MNRNQKIVLLFITSTIIAIGLSSFISVTLTERQKHTFRAKECKQKVLDCLITNGRNVQKGVEIDYLKYYDIHDMSYSWLLFYLFTENETVFWNTEYLFWITANETMFLFDVWKYTK